jgi:hypothetical protein
MPIVIAKCTVNQTYNHLEYAKQTIILQAKQKVQHLGTYIQNRCLLLNPPSSTAQSKTANHDIKESKKRKRKTLRRHNGSSNLLILNNVGSS